MKKIFITGGHGFLGKNLREDLESNRDYEILSPARSELDLSDAQAVFDYWLKHRPDVLVHAAAFARGLGGNLQAKEDAFLMNEALVRAPLLAALKIGVERVIFCGTVAEYAHPYKNLPLKEIDVRYSLPHSGEIYYGLAKRLSNSYLEAISTRWGSYVSHLYFTNLYGPGDRFDAESGHVTSSMLLKFSDSLKAGQAGVNLWGSSETTRDFLFVQDAATAIKQLLVYDFDGVLELNVASGVETSMGELAKKISNALSFGGDITWDLEKPIGIEKRSVDVSKLRSIMPWSPTTLDDGLLSTISRETWLSK